MSELAYSLHLGSDKNKKNVSRKNAKSNTSGTTSLSNNAIQNARQLSRVDKHNYRKYDDMQDNIVIVRGTSSLVDDVKRLYKIEFDEALKEYNNKQTREDRKIKDYFNDVSDNSKSDLACELIIELGDKTYWDTKDNDFKKRMTSVYAKQVEDLEMLLPNFKVASAIIHYDETSPHLHIVGIPIKEKNKYGLSKQIGKSNVFTKDSLRVLQDKMRTLCIESFNKEYHLNSNLKTKQKGRNKDYNVKDMSSYIEMKKELEKRQENLDKANKKSLELDNNTIDIKDTINNLKKTPVIKNAYIISESDKNKITQYIDKVDKTNEDFKKMQMLSITLNNVDTELQDNRDKIKILTENNDALSLKVDTLSKNIEKKNKEIKELKQENSNLQNTVNYFKNLFNKLVRFIKDKIYGKEKERENYWEVSKDFYEHGIFSDNTIRDIHEEYIWNKENDNRSKEKDDFER